MALAVNFNRRLQKLAENQAFEPSLAWGLRMVAAFAIPLAWGIATGNNEEALWIALTAQSICWIELKGSVAQRLRVLVGGAALSLLFTFLGSITAANIWWSTLFMLFVGFLAGLFKNLGDRGSGLAIGVFVMFVIANADAPKDVHDLEHRMVLVAIGGIWNLLVSVIAIAAMPEQQPYRRSVGIIWKSISGLIEVVTQGWEKNTTRATIRAVYLKEKEVRAAIDSSLHFYETMAHQANRKNKQEYELAQLRKGASVVGAHVIAVAEELEGINIRLLDNELRLKLYAVFKALQQTVERMAIYVVTLRSEEELLMVSRIERLGKLLRLLNEYELPHDLEAQRRIRRFVQLCERSIKIIERSLRRLEEMGMEKPVYRSYSFVKTLLILHPKYWLRNIKLLFDFNTHTTRYAVRTALATTIALFAFKWFHIDHGYWITFTVFIVLQPYFGATFQKAIDRIIGTVLGGLAGGLLVRLPPEFYARELMLIVCCLCMVYYVRRKYSVAAFFITISLVILFSLSGPIHSSLIITRALCTLAGAGLAIFAGYALLPTWDKTQLPINLAQAFGCNYRYFVGTFFSEQGNTNWTRFKRSAESGNSNAFESFTRYVQEPSIGRKAYATFYQIITHNVRLTRELNNINLELEATDKTVSATATPSSPERVIECLRWFNKALFKFRESGHLTDFEALPLPEDYQVPFTMTSPQKIYVDKMIIELKAMHSDLEEWRGKPE